MSHEDRSSPRARGWVRLSGLPVTPGGPGRWRAAVESARIRAALGVNLAAQLVSCRLGREGVVRLEFRGGGWDRALGPIEDTIRAAIEQRLHRSIGRLEIVSVLDELAPQPAAKPEPVGAANDPRARWQRIAARIGARRGPAPGS